jgi:hypothetical protein
LTTVSARTKTSLGVLLAVVFAELTFGVVGLCATKGDHHSPLHPVAAVVDAAFTQPSAIIGPAALPSVLPKPTSPTTIATARRNVPARRTATLKPKKTAAPAAVTATSPSGSGCAAAFSWLSSHSAPGYKFVCPGYAEGHQAMTCINTAACPGVRVIVIAIPCPAAYMNEAHNSWIISGLAVGKIDPYGYCTTD